MNRSSELPKSYRPSLHVKEGGVVTCVCVCVCVCVYVCVRERERETGRFVVESESPPACERGISGLPLLTEKVHAIITVVGHKVCG